MAAAAASLFSLHPSSAIIPTRRASSWFPNSSSTSLTAGRRPRRQLCVAQAADLLGDFGARDPFPAEIESKFGEKVLGNTDTEHKILIPNLAALSLSQLSCDPAPTPLPVEEARKLMRKVIGWRLVTEDGPARLQCTWKVRDDGCGEELISRISKVAEPTGHIPSLQQESNQVKAELWTQSTGGLSMNDFIVAAKIDEIKVMDLVPKKRAWA